jgi:hypothetical protein
LKRLPKRCGLNHLRTGLPSFDGGGNPIPWRSCCRDATKTTADYASYPRGLGLLHTAEERGERGKSPSLKGTSNILTNVSGLNATPSDDGRSRPYKKTIFLIRAGCALLRARDICKKAIFLKNPWGLSPTQVRANTRSHRRRMVAGSKGQINIDGGGKRTKPLQKSYNLTRAAGLGYAMVLTQLSGATTNELSTYFGYRGLLQVVLLPSGRTQRFPQTPSKGFFHFLQCSLYIDESRK